jgi:hypothetical protein
MRVHMTAKKRASNNNKKNKGTEGLSHQMGHILYMAQLSGELDKGDLIDSMPKPEKERYKEAFEVLVENDLLQVLDRGSKQFFLINPEMIHEVEPMISGFVRGTKSELKVKHTPSNPFFHRGPIKDITHFIGRYEVISHIFDRLRHTEDCSIIGPRAIGKTSLLHFITHPEVIKKHHLDPQKYIYVYIDLQRFGESTQKDDIYFEMFKRLVSQLTQGGYFKEEEVNKLLLEQDYTGKKIQRPLFEIGDLEGLISTLSEKDFRIVYEFDEFESIANNPNFDFSFYGQLRSLSGNPAFRVAFITSSKQSMYDLTFDEEIKTSPFFRYFEDFRLGPMDSKEIEEFYELARENGAAFDSQIKDAIEKWSGGHPFLVQLGCDYFFDLVVSGGKFKTQEDERHLAIFLKRHKKHFAYFWSQVGKKQQACLWWLASGKSPGADCEEILLGLGDIFLVTTQKGKYMVFSSAFERYIQDIPFFG